MNTSGGKVREPDDGLAEFPLARVSQQQRLAFWRNPFLWLPAVALIASVISFVWASRPQGWPIEVHFKQGHGLQSGDQVKYRGIEVGTVTGIELDEQLSGVVVRIELLDDARRLAREGTRFWVERPRLGLGRMSGLETVMGAKYVGVSPGPSGGTPLRSFVGLEVPLSLTASEEQQVVVHFANGLGLQEGSHVKYRGIVVGEVTSIGLNPALQGVDVYVRLVTQAQALARAGSQFWIEVPRIELTGVRGLETAVTGPYLAVRPGGADAEVQREFVGLLHPPIESYRETGALELVLHSSERLGLQAGAPVAYRGLAVGQVVTVGLSSDALQVEARVVIEPRYANLVRENTRFWSTSGLDLNVGLRGINVSLDTLATVAAGGVAFATPDPPGADVHTGRRFKLEAEEVERWQTWRPSLVVGNSLLPRGGPVPQPQVALLEWESRQLGLKRTHQRTGWVTGIADEVWLAPADLLGIELSDGEHEQQPSGTLSLGGEKLQLPIDPIRVVAGTVVFQLTLPQTVEVARWPLDRLRHPIRPENIAIVGAGQQVPIDASRIAVESADRWTLSTSLAATEDWHGANVVSREDGSLIGIVILADGQSWIAPLSQTLIEVIAERERDRPPG